MMLRRASVFAPPPPTEEGTIPPRAVKLLAPAIESPSLSGTPGLETPAYELKFLLTEPQAREIEERVRGRLAHDPHADPSLGNAYRTTSLYCDTAQLEVFHRLGQFQRRKHRLRRYGDAPWIFLERKTKWGDRVQKRRTAIPDGELPLFANPLSEITWSGHWFHRHLCRRRLLPVCTIAYERLAYVGRSAEGPSRLTFDRHIQGTLTKEWRLEAAHQGMRLLTDQVICEFKYQSHLPALFKEIIQAMQLTPGPVSKYRAFLRALGHGAGGRRGDA
jgi:hypothetical protein